MDTKRYIALVVLIVSLPGFAQSSTQAEIRVDPHQYLGGRGSEPMSQLAIQGKLDWSNLSSPYPWKIQLHGDFESMGRKDNSIDIDRAWVEIPLEKESGPLVVLGRIHPLDISRNFEAKRPWGYLAQSQPQNRGILLGSPFTNGVFPDPTIQGWLGGHFWSDSRYQKAFQWGVSASPVFVPSMGASVDYSGPVASRAGRFGRQAPGYVEIKGQRYSIDYEIDTSEISNEVLQPQLMAHTYGRLGGPSLQWESWLVIRRAPSVEPTLTAVGKLDLRENTPQARATVRPTFPERFSTSLSQRITSDSLPKNSALFTSLEWEETGRFGGEIGFEIWNISLAYANEYRPARDTAYSLEDAPYSQHLLQVDAKLPASFATFYGGAKWHFTTGGAWIRAGVRSDITKTLGVDLGTDLFVGGRDSFFGEWRTNDRVYLGLTWRLG